MSTARIEQLKTLLARVQERREQPRLRAVEAIEPVGAGRISNVMPAPARLELPELPESQLSEAQVREAFSASLPAPAEPQAVVVGLSPAADVVADTPSRRAPTLSDAPAVTVEEDSDEPEITTSYDSEPPRAASVIPATESAELTAPSQRIEAPALALEAPITQVVSTPRVEGPKNFGELLEASLSLRPR